MSIHSSNRITAPQKCLSYDEGLLKLKARMMLRKIDGIKRVLADTYVSTLSYRAFNLGKENESSTYNPFCEIEHEFQQELISSYALGATPNSQQSE